MFFQKIFQSRWTKVSFGKLCSRLPQTLARQLPSRKSFCFRFWSKSNQFWSITHSSSRKSPLWLYHWLWFGPVSQISITFDGDFCGIRGGIPDTYSKFAPNSTSNSSEMNVFIKNIEPIHKVRRSNSKKAFGRTIMCEFTVQRTQTLGQAQERYRGGQY